jgi:hypothetical protein
MISRAFSFLGKQSMEEGREDIKAKRKEERGTVAYFKEP